VGKVLGLDWINLALKATARGRNVSAAVTIVVLATQTGLIRAATLLGEIFAATESSVTAVSLKTDINRGVRVRHGESKAELATTAISPEVGGMATASLPPTRFETTGGAIGMMVMFRSIAVGKETDGTATMIIGIIGVTGVATTTIMAMTGSGGAGPQRRC
jgi:hypothetical protein